MDPKDDFNFKMLAWCWVNTAEALTSEADTADAADEAWAPYFRENQLDMLLTEPVRGVSACFG